MNILVIGGAGYIGSHVTYELCDQGYNVKVLDNLSTGFIGNIDKRSDFINKSFSDKNILSLVLKDIDCVVHLAGLKAAGDSMNKPIEYSEKNIVDSIKLINICIQNKVKNFIFSSSAAVYGNPKYLPINEDHPCEPINYYGFTKLAIEQQLLWYNKLKGINVACLRYFNAAGFDVQRRVKEREKNAQNLLQIVMEVANGTRKKICIFGNDYNTSDGTCLRDYIHVNDLAKSHTKAIEILPTKKKIVTNLSTGNSHSVLEVIKMVEQVTKKKINYSFGNRRIGDPESLYANSNNILNYSNHYSDLSTIVKSMWDVYNF